MILLWLNDRNIYAWRAALQDRCDCDARGAATDDENIMVC
jgi:hypothetical protein